MATATVSHPHLDLVAGLRPGIPISHGLKKKPKAAEGTQWSVPRGTNEPVNKDSATGRDILHQSTDRDSLVAQAKSHGKLFEDGLKAATRGIAGAKFDAVRSEKDTARLDEKINAEGKPVHTVPDILAGRISVDSPAAHTRTAESIKKHFNVIRDEDQFEHGDPDTGYRVHKMQVQVTPELSAEAHIVPRDVLEANAKQHEVYEDARSAELDGKDKLAEQKTKHAKTINDSAMAAFNARNGVEAAKSSTEGGGVQSPEQSVAGAGSSVPATLKKGDAVRMKDGTHGTVDFVPAWGKLGKTRVKTADGRTVRDVPQKELTPTDGSYIAVDLDSTLANYTKFEGPTVIGKPIPEMVDRVKKWLADGEDVRIFTARVAEDKSGQARKAIEAWLKEHIGRTLPITNVKDHHMKILYDDRAVQVGRNTGELLGKPEAATA